MQVRWATPGRWPDLEKLFGERGACGGCWCMVWRLPRGRWESGKGAVNRLALKRLVDAGKRPGVIGYLGRQAVAWCALAPREQYSYFQRTRVLKPIDDKPVWSVSCLFVLRAYRRQGLSVWMLDAAAGMAARRGARIVEGYPAQPTMERTPDAFVWTGVPSAFEKAGFTEVLRPSPNRPIMRREVK